MRHFPLLHAWRHTHAALDERGNVSLDVPFGSAVTSILVSTCSLQGCKEVLYRIRLHTLDQPSITRLLTKYMGLFCYRPLNALVAGKDCEPGWCVSIHDTSTCYYFSKLSKGLEVCNDINLEKGGLIDSVVL